MQAPLLFRLSCEEITGLCLFFYKMCPIFASRIANSYLRGARRRAEIRPSDLIQVMLA